jgi:2-keto-4-pentenoate hydratase/2-oxohepta-3-ene-1,7-dioic acid hydratase in catechol pathway
MRIARVAFGDSISYGVVSADAGLAADGSWTGTVSLVDGVPFGGSVSPTGVVKRMADVRLLAPVMPSKIVAIGKNYADHAAEMKGEVPTEPLMFLKPSSSIVGPGDAIRLPAITNIVHHEAELAVVISRMCRDVDPEDAHSVVLGYTCANDVSARDLQKSDGQWTRAKGFDTFCPLGPWIETDVDPADTPVRCCVNSEVRQEGNSGEMVFDVPALIAAVSSVMTLIPGDVILTGTPAGVGPIVAGDTVYVECDGIGILANPVVAR